MAFTEINDVNTSAGVHTLFQYSADIVPIFIPLLMFAMFIIVLMGSYFTQRRLTGKGDFPASFSVAGFILVVMTFVLSLIPNLVNDFLLIIAVVIALLGMVWLYLSRRESGL